MLLDNPAAHGQSKPRAASPCTEATVKDPGYVLFGDSRPCVAHFDFYARTPEIRASNAEPPSFRHEAKRVQRQIEEHLFEKMSVRPNDNTGQPIDNLEIHARLMGEWQQKVIGPGQQLSRVERSSLGRWLVVQVEHIIDGGR